MLVFSVGFVAWLAASGAALGLGFEFYRRQKHVRAFLCASVAWAIIGLPYTWIVLNGGAPAFLAILMNIPLAVSLMLACVAILRRKAFGAS